MRVKLGDVCERGTSNLKLSDVSEKNGEFSVFGASGYIGSVDFYQQGYPYVAVVKDGAGIGRAMLCPGKTSVIGTMQYLLPKDNILPKYLFYVVKYMNLEKYFTGATIPHIYFKDYKNEEFNFDFWERQVEIVSVLSKCEKVIDLCKQELQLLGQAYQSPICRDVWRCNPQQQEMASLFICRDHFFTIGENARCKTANWKK